MDIRETTTRGTMTRSPRLERVLGAGGARHRTDWLAVERQLGLALPADYKAFADDYGPGTIDKFLNVLVPTDNVHLDLLSQVRLQLEALRVLRESGSEPVLFEPTAAIGGLVPFAITENGDVSYWQVASSDPSTWTVATNESRGPSWSYFHGGFAAFIVALLDGTHRVPFFPPDFPGPDIRFEASPVP
jgi:hypothetical protein